MLVVVCKVYFENSSGIFLVGLRKSTEVQSVNPISL
jgi:hypothetical protein